MAAHWSRSRPKGRPLAAAAPSDYIKPIRAAVPPLPGQPPGFWISIVCYAKPVPPCAFFESKAAMAEKILFEYKYFPCAAARIRAV
jgi:hypothetical protein